MQKEQKRQYISKTQVSLIAPAVEEIERAFTQNDLTVCKLAAMCTVSEVYFRRLFLNTFGISPKEYIIQKRIEYAKTLLSSKDFSVGEVGILCGYTEPCHFSREFSKRVGTSPMQYENL
jgi:AraC family transcriptional regulator